MAVETKVGVYLCSGCGIGDAIDIAELSKVVSDELKIPVCKSNSWLCSQEGIDLIKTDIEKEELNRTVIGACSHRFLTDVFQFGEKVLTDRVSLRENVVWTHEKNNEDTQMLAADCLRMGVAKVQNSEPPEPVITEVNETVLVVGGGVSGMTSAIAAAKAGSSVILTEKENKHGGWLNRTYKVVPTINPFA